GKMEFVLDDLENAMRLGFVRRIVGSQREDVADAQIHPLLARADVADALEQLIEVVRDPWTGRVLQPLVVHGETLNQVFAQSSCRPLPELRSSRTADAIADGEDRFETVVVDLAFDRTGTLNSNYPEFPDSWPSVQFALVENIDEMFIDRANIFVEQLRNLRLRQPDRLIFEPALNPRSTVFGAVENNARLRGVGSHEP